MNFEQLLSEFFFLLVITAVILYSRVLQITKFSEITVWMERKCLTCLVLNFQF